MIRPGWTTSTRPGWPALPATPYCSPASTKLRRIDWRWHSASWERASANSGRCCCSTWRRLKRQVTPLRHWPPRPKHATCSTTIGTPRRWTGCLPSGLRSPVRRTWPNWKIAFGRWPGQATAEIWSGIVPGNERRQLGQAGQSEQATLLDERVVQDVTPRSATDESGLDACFLGWANVIVQPVTDIEQG